MNLPHDNGSQHPKHDPRHHSPQERLEKDKRMVKEFTKALPDQAPLDVQQYIVEEIAKGVGYHAETLSGGRIVLSAEDCASAAIAHILQHIHQWNHESTLRTWAAAAGRHYILNLISSQKHRDTADEHGTEEHLQEALDAHARKEGTHGSAGHWASHLDEERLHRAIAALRGTERIVIGLILGGAHIGEIAKQLNRSRETIRKYKNSAFARLREALDQR